MARRFPASFVVVIAALVLLSAGCASMERYEPETAANPAMGEMSSTGLLFHGMVEFGRPWYVFGKTEKGEGTMVIDGGRFEWRNSDRSDRSFALRADVVREAWLTCASRPGENLCLQLSLETLTGDRYHFRDRNWSGGENQQILQIWDYLRVNFRHVHYYEEAVDGFR